MEADQIFTEEDIKMNDGRGFKKIKIKERSELKNITKKFKR